ncbi:hypothetical protein, conserved [Trypanosoma brucei gambiense DAL972]|uniref:Midasin n=1 Tax=Trypanosoma brucei gambiense (strain MHOM/CI/86/DAL972) TaxID=679716 RepID=C9ZHW5_TRYB9|nr:hypothetical protein, conserved [Trypanosoma brucei gambiense DAL972]CBH08836.1 hypothetical protein, conserved [Trypanosoma brucei gambiense DAL972]|eukprot:XP_011771277.1 hypothetical protein, conserved [Trypanosoma brucei gambiense DAL972]
MYMLGWQTMILTAVSEQNLRNLKVTLDTSRAVLVQGEVGCGKSFFVKALAEECGAYSTMIQINVDDSFDSRDLLGKFSATDVPGAFEWVPGPLTTAVANGLWILMEDIDLASFDVFSVLLSLLEESTLFLPDKNKRINAHPNFRIIATQQLRSVGDTFTTRKSNSVPFGELWGVTVLKSLPPEEICVVATSLYSVPRSVVSALTTLPSRLFGTSLVTLRSLLKWCKRVSRRLPNTNLSNEFISSTIREMMFREAYDCMLAGFPKCDELIRIINIMAECVGILPNVADSLAYQSKPEMRSGAEYFTVGRVTLPLYGCLSGDLKTTAVFAATKHSMSLLERIAAAVDAQENVLLTGETGVGKTFVVQYLADKVGQKLIVHNLDQQTDTSDFMGGWKPLDVGVAVRNAYQDFVDLFSQCFNASRNAEFLSAVQMSMKKCSWLVVVKQILKGCSSFKLKNIQHPFSTELQERWLNLENVTQDLLATLHTTRNTFAFRFEEGSLTRAWREGYWILLDEVNLASTEILERVSAVLGDVDALYLTDKVGSEPIKRHKNFHVFANMNPPTDVGKKDIPPSLRSKFTEIYVSEPFEQGDISIVVSEFIGHLATDCKIQEVTSFFLEYVGKAKSALCSLDGGTKPPTVSLRTLTRALTYVRKATSQYGFALALFDGLMLGFATPLERQFHSIVEQLIKKHVFDNGEPPRPTLPRCPSGGRFVAYEHIWLPVGSEEPRKDESFILTPSVKGHLLNVARAVFADRPVLLEGPTSSGKSSMVKYLAEFTGHKFIRINNHESTEIQEYVGHYISDERGKLRFVDGILVDAVRNGYWIMLDELNLAPTEVLEALNRLLDDNHELFVADTQETIKPHPHLRIFATQNPAGVYGGRKLLSRAFRNRFLEITVDDIPNTELCTILCQRYSLSPSFAEKMVEVMTTLQIRRQGSRVFAGRHGFVTPRDLFRWAERCPGTYQEMAEHGFLLLVERCRKTEERQIVKDVIESITKTELNESDIYSPHHWPYVAEHYKHVESRVAEEFGIVWTESMLRLFTVVGICLFHREPVLLVGETGSSKTTVCQVWAAILQRRLSIVNCHQHSEAADFLGSLRPALPNQQSSAIFQWRNGPLVECMLKGGVFVLDEISLAEDSVLERLNSVLEPGRTVTLAEKSTADVIFAHEDFRILATMNPGGDFGKRELSPALRNRFTEIYVRPTVEREEVTLILSKRLNQNLSHWAAHMASLLCDAASVCSVAGVPQHISIRDIIGWVSFMNAADGHCDEQVSFVHGLDAVILDGVGVGTGQSDMGTHGLREALIAKVREVCKVSSDCLREPFWELFDTLEEPTLPPEMKGRFFFGAPSTSRNLSKLVRAGIMRRAILLEGSPGVGKTSIVEALGCALRKHVVRVNLSEQTDIMDLFGTFLPCPSSGDSGGPQFSWSDGVLLHALKNGWWVILDELNLASQSVLEGLNALLDHRSTVFIPELGEEFQAADGFRVFACQNPLAEGGGRKGLPRSFLNRFTRVRIEPFDVEDLMRIVVAVAPGIGEATLCKMVGFVDELHREVVVRRAFGVRGSPWEFNLRDILRWAKLMEAYGVMDMPCEFVDMLFTQRMRTDTDRKRTVELVEKIFGSSAMCGLTFQESHFLIANDAVHFGSRFLTRRVQGSNPFIDTAYNSLMLLPSQAGVVRSLLTCAEQNQLCILAGPTGAGKTFCIRAAAALAGARLLTFSMNASCDTVDLLGGFDQVEGKQGQFEWSDSLILEAMQSGHWLVLDNVNYCNASVLDRLNPLVEPNGMLSVNEQGLVDGQVRVVRPHPNFRLFMTLDPKYGEVSRAMRNRAVEIYVHPVEIPSLESLAISGASTSCRSVEHLEMLNRYHREFLRSLFSADSALPMSTQLSDALASGTPNTFTLVKTASMLSAASNLEDLKMFIRHKYIDNRCGHWNVRKDEVATNLDMLVAAGESDACRCFPSVADLLNALSVTGSSEGSGSALESVEEALVRIRVLRSGLALRAQLTAEGSHQKCHSLSDLVLYFVLDQCADGVLSHILFESRRQLLCWTIGDALSEQGMNDVLSLISLQPTTDAAAHLDSIWCSSAPVLGPHASSLKALRDANIFISDSPVVNNSFNRMLSAMGKVVEVLSSPSLQQRIFRLLGPLARLVCSSFPQYQINVDNYVSLLTNVLLIRSVIKKQLGSTADIFFGAVDEFLSSLRNYLGLPFQLVLEGLDIRKRIVRPHITTAEERAALVAWKASATSALHEKHECLLKSLWDSAIFRAEFSLVLRAQQLRANCSVPVAKRLQCEVLEFVNIYCTKLRVVPQLNVTLWREVTTIPLVVERDAAALSSLVPLLTTNFLSRYGLNGGRHILCGSWTSLASDALDYAAEVSVAAIDSKSNPHVRTLDNLLEFCRVLPMPKVDPFEEWEANCLTEALSLLEMCQVPHRALNTNGFSVPEEPSTAMLVQLLSKLRTLLAETQGNPLIDALRPVLSMIVHSNDCTPDDSLRRIALVGVLRCRMLIPRTPIDPMYKWLVKKEVARNELVYFSRLDAAFSWSEELSMRGSCSRQRLLLQGLQAEEEAHLARALEKVVVRPDSTGAKFAQLVDLLHQTCSSMLSDSRLEVVVAQRRSETAAARKAWSEVVYQQFIDVLDNYGGYEDVTLTVSEPALSATLAAYIGYYMQTRPVRKSMIFSVPDAVRMMHFPSTSINSPVLPSSGSQSLQQRLAYLDSCLLLVQCTPARVIKRDFVEKLFDSYRELYRAVEELEAKERSEQELSVLYKEKAVIIEGDDEAHMGLLKQLFPSYEEEFIRARDAEDDKMEDATNDEVDLNPAPKPEVSALSTGRHARLMLSGPQGAKYMQRLLDTHYHFFERLLELNDGAAFCGDRHLEAFKGVFDVVSKELRGWGCSGVYEDGSLVRAEDEQMMAGGFAARATLLSKCLFSSETPLSEAKATKFNIFTDPAPSELRAFNPSLLSLMQAITELSAAYPDTPSLRRCSRIATCLAALPVLTTPLMKVMTGCEILLRECYEWERNASRDTSIMDHMTHLSTFVLRWRRLELHCWGQVFAAKREEWELKVGKVWFSLCDLTGVQQPIPMEELQDRYAKFFHYCMDFMWGARCGDFHARLRLLKAFAFHLAAAGRRSSFPLANASCHLTDFFTQYSQLVEQKLRIALSPIEEDMEEFTRIMRWEDSTYYAVRATAEKSHLKMGRGLASLEDVLRTPVLQIISTEEQRCEDDQAMGFTLASLQLEEKNGKKNKKQCAQGAVDMGLKRSRMGRINAKAKTAVSGCEAPPGGEDADSAEGKLPGYMSEGVEFLKFAANEIIERVNALQARSVPQNQKLRALKTLFTVMEEKGVPHTHALQVSGWEELFATSSALLPCRNIHKHLVASKRIEEAAQEYYRGVRWLQRMRDAEKHPHKDLSDAQVKRGAGTAESLFAVAVQEAELIGNFCEVRQQIALLRDFISTCEDRAVPTGAEQLHASMEMCVQLQSFVYDVRWMLQEHIFDLEGSRSTIDELYCLTEELWKLCCTTEGQRRAEIPIADAIMGQYGVLYGRVRLVCSRLCSTGVGCVDSASSKLCESLDLLGESINCAVTASMPTRAVSAKRNRTEVGAQWEGKVTVMVESLESAFAKNDGLTDFFASSPGHQQKEENSTGGGGTDLVYRRYAETVGKLLAEARTAHSSLHTLLHDETHDRKISSTARTQLLSRLDVCVEHVGLLLQGATRALLAQSHLTLVVSRLLCILFRKGFCKSEEEEEEDGDGDGEGGDGNQLDGTGMDDGQGEKDVTDQIENEDQLMSAKDKNDEEQEEKQQDKGDGSSDGEDNAADVETDFAAPKERRDDDDEEDEDDGDESEREMGSVDGEEVQERKRMKKETNEGNDLDSDDGGNADDVPEDELANEEESIDGNEGDQETANFENREAAIREAEEQQQGEEHDLAADALEGGENDSHDGGDGDGESNTCSDEGEREGSEGDDDDNAGDSDDEAHNGSGEASSVSSDNARDIEGEDNGKDDNEGEGTCDSGDFCEDKEDDWADENVYNGGQQDERTGEEATEEREKESKKRPRAAQQEAGTTEEQQPGEEEQQDEAGRNWKRQNRDERTQHRDNAERHNTSRNPYRAIKEAVERHQRSVQQLNLNKRVEVKKHREADNQQQNEQQSNRKEVVDEFEFDEEGEEEGMAATDEKPVVPTEATNNLPEQREAADSFSESGTSEELDEGNDEDTPPRHRKHAVEVSVDTESSEEEGDEEDAEKKKARRNVKVASKIRNDNEEEEDSFDNDDKTADSTGGGEYDKLCRGRELWQEQTAAVHTLSHQLCEQLRLILSPTVADKLQGDYKTGKRLNMKRIIPYIASQFKKDRIWLRRTKPNKRSYQILVALDDSLSMQCNNAGIMSCRAVALIAEALQQLEVGELGIACFGKETRIVHEMHEPFVAESGPRAFSEITFAQKSTNLKLLLETTLDYLDDARRRMNGQIRSSTQRLQQMMFIISDGQITEDRMELRKLLMRAEENHQMVVFVLLDVKASGGENDNNGAAPLAPISVKELAGMTPAQRMRRLKAERDSRLQRVKSNSVLDMQLVEFRGGSVVRRSYMEEFPFPHYLIVRELETLPSAIADALRQWFELLNVQH